MTRGQGWDVFCRVVDHYGDIGVAWRLARQLATDGIAVRLFVDDLETFARIEPRVDPRRAHQLVAGIAIERFDADVDERDAIASVVVIEMFGCGLPDRHRSAMEAAPMRTTWIEIEHLSAETWVGRFHGRPSPQPHGALVRHYFYPGFASDTGGLFVERDLAAMQAAFVRDATTRRAMERSLGLRSDEANASRALVFAYPSAPVDALLDAMARDRGRRWTLLVSDRRDPSVRRDGVDVRRIPFVPQVDFDRLLMSCDVAFVRGEDSFVRAQLAGIPFVWQAYPQADDAHRVKVDAFLDLYLVGLDEATADAHRTLVRAWNGWGDDVANAWPRWIDCLDALAGHAQRWRRSLLAAPPLVERLVRFVAARRADSLQ